MIQILRKYLRQTIVDMWTNDKDDKVMADEFGTSNAYKLQSLIGSLADDLFYLISYITSPRLAQRAVK